MDDLAKPKKLLIQVLQTVIHIAVRAPALAAMMPAISVGYWMVVIKDSQDSMIDYRDIHKQGRMPYETV